MPGTGISRNSRSHVGMGLIFMLFILACIPNKTRIDWKTSKHAEYTGTSFYKQTSSFGWKQRDSLAIAWILAGHIPAFITKLEKVSVSMLDSTTGKTIEAIYFVSPDYLSVGNDEDWARVPLTPMAAQEIADSLHCFLPTRKMVDDIYKQAKMKLEPVPMFAFRDSTPTMWQHHLMIEGQRKGRKGLIAGIKKDVVISSKLISDGRPNRVAIYGWHKADGKPIQPLYTGHVNWYVDYSHGIRFIHETIYIKRKPMHYTDVLKHPVYSKLLCDEVTCDCSRYPANNAFN